MMAAEFAETSQMFDDAMIWESAMVKIQSGDGGNDSQITRQLTFKSKMWMSRLS